MRVTKMGLLICFRTLKTVWNSGLIRRQGWTAFFLAIKYKGNCPQNFFKRQKLGISAFKRIFKAAFLEKGISGTGFKTWVTAHGLRGTMDYLIFAAGHFDSSVSMRTGHLDPRSLYLYQNLKNLGRKLQQKYLLGHSVVVNNSDYECDDKLEVPEGMESKRAKR